MKEKKQSASWYIAATHYLTAGFAMPFLLTLALGAIILVFHIKIESKLISVLFSLAFRILAIWLGVMYSARYIAKTYILKKKSSVVNLATTYIIVLSLGYTAVQFLLGKIAIIDVGFNSIATIIAAFLFYFFSKKYIKEDIGIGVVNSQGQFQNYQAPPLQK